MKRNSWRIYGNSSYVTGRRFGSRLRYQRATVDVLIQGILSYKPIAYWPLNDPAGSTTARDVTGNGFTGQAPSSVSFGATGLTNYGESSAQFSSNYLTVTDFPALNPISAIYLVNYSAAGYSSHLVSGNESSDGFLTSESNSGPTVYAQTFPNGTAGTNIALALNTTGFVTYVNSESVGSMTINNSAPVQKSQPLNPVQGLQIGSGSTPARMAHVAIFNRPLTQAEITAIYQLATATPTLVFQNSTDAAVGVNNNSNLGVVMGNVSNSGDIYFWIQKNPLANGTLVSNGAGLIVDSEMMALGDGTYGTVPMPPYSQTVPLGDGIYPPAANNLCFVRFT